MDSQEKAPEMGMEKLQAEAVQEEQVVNEPQQVVADEVKEKKVYASKKEVVERVKEIAHGEENPQKEEVDYLKMMFYKLLVTEREATLKDYIEKGGDPETYQVIPDEDEEVFKAEMAVIKERRAQLFKQQEEEKEKNLKRKLEIIERIKSMITSPEEANQSFQEFKALQQEWKEIKNVPAPQVSELWRNYQLYVEQFYDLLKLNSEAREYDFKKNLETKTRLCEAAEKLAEQDDLISAFYQLQELHQEYRETGPVAKEMREEIWARFKAASTVINKRHQQYFEQLRAKEEENLVKKTELCEKAEALLAEERKGSADWERHTKEMIEIQTEWKTIGFAPQKMNVKIFERFRAACDSFFEKKAAYFKELKENFKINAEKKRALIAKANELKDSQEWRSTSDKLIALQKEWKTIGAVPKKLGDQLWEEFLAACNHFFEARNAAGAGQRSEEHGNLEKKRDVIARLKALQESAADNLQEAVQQLVDEYGQIGHVPFKEKDKLYAEYHETLNALYRTLNVNVAKRRLNNFKNKLKTVAEQGGNALDNERARLVRHYETLKQEVQTYENNLCFLSVSSKKGNSLIDEMNRKVQKLKDDMNLVLEKIKAIDNQ
ncbi:MAG: DUF349 domain-containing protein [Prevotella sp.]|nr:DUF349 domain-containing protein [Prevotella sp.]